MSCVRYFQVALAIIFFLPACSVQKRRYLAGYHFERHSGHAKPVKKENGYYQLTLKRAAQPTAAVKGTSDGLLAAAGDIPALSAVSKRPDFFRQIDSCDQVVMRTGDEVSVKILEIDPEFVRYKRCDNLQGPVYTVRKSEIFMIKYTNGTKEVFKQPAEKQTVQPVPGSGGRPAALPHSAKKTLPSAVFSFVLAVLALFLPIELIVVMLLMEATAFVLGISSVNRINNNSDYYRGKGYAITAIVISAIVLTMLVILFMAV